jgi:PASTA domain
MTISTGLLKLALAGWLVTVGGSGAAALLGAALVLATPIAFVASSTATAAPTAPEVQTIPLQVDTVVANTDGEKVLISEDLVLRAGESRRVIGQVSAVMSTPNASSMDDTVLVQCLTPTGIPSGVTSGAETSLVPGQIDALRPSLLFTAPAAGTYRCQLLASVGVGHGSLTALKGITFLMLSTGDEVGSHWWQNPDCDPRGEWSTCTYLGDPGGRREAYLFADDGTPPYQWTAAADATQVGMVANVELTTCGHTASCGGRRHDADHSTVTSSLEAVQLNAAGQVCNITRSAPRTEVVGIIPHHYNIARQLSAPVLPTCGSRRFMVRVYMQLVDGNPVKIDGSVPDAVAPVASTTALAYNSVYADTTTVPAVIGLSQAAATAALTAARLTVGTVTGVVNPAPAGTVLGQNAVAGTVEPINSQVDLTVSLSLATVTVPRVVGQDEFSAMNQIEAAGLTVGTRSMVNTCEVDPGIVIGQSPPGGRA